MNSNSPQAKGVTDYKRTRSLTDMADKIDRLQNQVKDLQDLFKKLEKKIATKGANKDERTTSKST